MELKTYELILEYPTSPKKGSKVVYNRVNGVYQYNDRSFQKNEIENNKFWSLVNPFKVGDKIIVDGVVRTVTESSKFSIAADDVYYHTSEFDNYGILRATEKSIAALEKCDKYHQKLFNSHWIWMRRNRPDVYWLEILRLIAKDYNDPSTEASYLIVAPNGYGEVIKTKLFPLNSVRFTSKDGAEIAIQIINGNLKYLL